MKPTLLFGGAFVVLCGMALPPLCQTAPAADNGTNLSVSRLPLDLARTSVGTKLQVREPAGAPHADARTLESLLSEDATREYSLSAGTTSFILSLSRIEVLHHFNFINNGAEGTITVSVANTNLPFDAAGWRTVGKAETFDGRRVVDCDFGSVDGRYVKVDFQTHTAGRIAGFGLFGSATVSNFRQAAVNYVTTPTRTEVANTSETTRGAFFDYASLTMGAKVVAVSHADSLADAQYMIDGDMSTAFTFDASDPNPMVVVDLGTRRTLDRVSCVFEAPAGQMDFYLVENAYTGGSEPVALNYVTPPGVMPVSNAETLNYTGEKTLSKRRPVGSVTTSGEPGVNRVSVNLNGMQGRFLIAAFHRSGPAPQQVVTGGDGRDGKDFKDAGDFKDAKDNKNVAGIADNPVKVEGISAFGEPPPASSIPLLPLGPANAGRNGTRPPGTPPDSGNVSP